MHVVMGVPMRSAMTGGVFHVRSITNAKEISKSQDSNSVVPIPWNARSVQSEAELIKEQLTANDGSIPSAASSSPIPSPSLQLLSDDAPSVIRSKGRYSGVGQRDVIP